MLPIVFCLHLAERDQMRIEASEPKIAEADLKFAPVKIKIERIAGRDRYGDGGEVKKTVPIIKETEIESIFRERTWVRKISSERPVTRRREEMHDYERRMSPPAKIRPEIVRNSSTYYASSSTSAEAANMRRASNCRHHRRRKRRRLPRYYFGWDQWQEIKALARSGFSPRAAPKPVDRHAYICRCQSCIM